MHIKIVRKDFLSVPCELLVVYLFQGVTKLHGAPSAVDKVLGDAISKLIKQDAFEGTLGQVLVFPTFGMIKAKRVAVIGLGDKRRFNADAIRRVGGCIVKLASQHKVSSVVTILYGDEVGRIDHRTSVQALTEGVILSAYRFHSYHGTLRKKETPPTELKLFTICETSARAMKIAEDGIMRGRALATATCFARDLVNTPSADMMPTQLVEEAKKLTGRGITVKVMDRKEMKLRGMHATLAVARGSDCPPFGVHLVYKPRGVVSRRAQGGIKKKVVIVGKAVTFDSGGLNIKHGDSMSTMKIDMAGAATVLGLFKALAEIPLNIEVHGIFLAVENMPSGSAYRPGDVVKAMDGTTIEILNTDAEGRVTLVDAIAYAKTLKPDIIIDLATLTGACIVALGDDIAGLLTNDHKLGQRLLDAAKDAGEPLWELPLYEPYMELIKSKIADIKNVGSRSSGVITAALFLKPFVGDTPWAHIDIAGPSYVEHETRPDLPYGASGYGVRLLARFLQKL